MRLDPDAEHLTDDGLLARLGSPTMNVQAWDDARRDPAETSWRCTARRGPRAARARPRPISGSRS